MEQQYGNHARLALHRNVKVTFSNYGTVGIGEPMGIRVLSGVQFLKVLDYLLPLCNEDTSPVTPALIFRGVTDMPLLHPIYKCFRHVTNFRTKCHVKLIVLQTGDDVVEI
ncbi:hypothetical protein HanRHA438_Chr01g0006601 [Helianthus annuus]|nr:hypothetical protein HanRHA438_Chr01g0006601 [Helianthus annuus]